VGSAFFIGGRFGVREGMILVSMVKRILAYRGRLGDMTRFLGRISIIVLTLYLKL